MKNIKMLPFATAGMDSMGIMLSVSNAVVGKRNKVPAFMGASQVVLVVKNLPANARDVIRG